MLTRAGRPIARLGPAPSHSGARLKKVLRTHEVDSSWPAELRSLRESLSAEARAWDG